jgi:tripartite-type tricarboxylate transporter receptor subunit TctC
VSRLNGVLVQVANDPEVKALLEKLGTTSSPSSAAELGRFVGEETQKWARIHDAAGIEKQ